LFDYILLFKLVEFLQFNFFNAAAAGAAAAQNLNLKSILFILSWQRQSESPAPKTNKMFDLIEIFY